MRPDQITALTVTYGKRWPLLAQTLTSIFASGVGSVIIVDNNSSEDIRYLVREHFPTQLDRVKVVRLEQNNGSAGGYAVGIENALQSGGEAFLLLDDDNELAPGTLQTLISALEVVSSRHPERISAVLASRHGHGGVQANSAGDLRQEADCFLSFHLLDVGRKISKLMGKPAPARHESFDHYDIVQAAPYGGLLLPASAAVSIGLPNRDMLLYADDHEYTYRITAANGVIYRIPNAVVNDVDVSWTQAGEATNSLTAWIMGKSEFRIFYTARNHAFFEKHIRKHNRFVRLLNRAAYLLIMFANAAFKGRLKRFYLIYSAVRDGENRRLGRDPRFPLP